MDSLILSYFLTLNKAIRKWQYRIKTVTKLWRGSKIVNGLNGILVTQLTGNLQLGHPTQKVVSHLIILLKIFIQVIRRYTPLKIWRKAD